MRKRSVTLITNMATMDVGGINYFQVAISMDAYYEILIPTLPSPLDMLAIRGIVG